MSRARSLAPLVIATAFGIFNGVWVFGPALKEQQEQKQLEHGKILREVEKEDNEITKLRHPSDTTEGATPTLTDDTKSLRAPR